MLQSLPPSPRDFPSAAAFWARNFRDSGEKSNISLRDISKLKQQLKVKRPKLRSKNKGGARKGNRHAFKHGLYSNEMRQLRLTVRRTVAEAKLTIALARIAIVRMDMQTTERLHRAGFPRRALWPSELQL